MKKLVLFTLILLCAFTFDSTAQRKRKRTATSQGNFVLRLGMGYNSDRNSNDFTDTETSMNAFKFNPTLTYMVIDNLEVGVNFGVNNYNNENTRSVSPLNRVNTNGTDISFGLFAQKYFPLNNWFAFYTSANLGLVTGSYESDSTFSGTTYPVLAGSGEKNGVMGGLNFGFGFTPYNAFAIWSDFAGINVMNVKNNPDGASNTRTETSTNFGVMGSGNTPINLGVAWYFGRGLWRK